MSTTNIAGINDEKMKKLLIDMTAYKERINEILIQIEDIMGELKNSYNSEAADCILLEFEQYKNKFKTIISNVQNYSDDLEKVRKQYSYVSFNGNN